MRFRQGCLDSGQLGLQTVDSGVLPQAQGQKGGDYAVEDFLHRSYAR